jgi:hypothetical protein
MMIDPSDCCRYCSEKCVYNDLSVHSNELEALKALSKLNIGGRLDEIRLLIKIAAKRKYQNDHHNQFKDVNDLEQANSMMSIENKKQIEEIADLVSRHCIQFKVPLSKIEATRLFFITQCNAHQISSNQDECIALGLFPLTSMMNHSCAPNCCHYFEIIQGQAPKLIMVALEDIKANTELCYSYVPLYQSRTERNTQLEKAYSFICTCLRCIDRTMFPDDSIIGLTDKTIDNASEHYMEQLGLRINDVCFQIYDDKLSIEEAITLKKEIISLLSLETLSSSISQFNPYNRLMFQCYVALSSYTKSMETAVNIADMFFEDYVSSLKFIIGYGVLALGCIFHFTKSKQVEFGKISQNIMYACNKLDSFGFTFDMNNKNNKMSSYESTLLESNTNSKVIDRIASQIYQEEFLSSFIWRQDQNILNILKTGLASSSTSFQENLFQCNNDINIHRTDMNALLEIVDDDDDAVVITYKQLGDLFKASAENVFKICRRDH